MIILENLGKHFNRGSVNQVLALDKVNLRIAQNDFLTIIGSNGAGKSTLLNCLAGSIRPEHGGIRIGDRDVTLWREHQRAQLISRVFQDPLRGTCASLSIEQNLALAYRRGARRGLRRGVHPQERRQFRRQLAHLKLGLEDRLQDPVGLLSGGQRQALTLLMASLVRPEVLLLDEHTAALDPKTAQHILDLTKEIVEKQGITTLMVTHNMNQALRLGNRLLMMHRGQIILDIGGEHKQTLTVESLLARFYEMQGEQFSSDRMLLA